MWDNDVERTTQHSIDLLHNAVKEGKYLFVGINSSSMTMMFKFDKESGQMKTNHGFYVYEVTEDEIKGYYVSDNLTAGEGSYPRESWYVDYVGVDDFITLEELQILGID